MKSVAELLENFEELTSPAMLTHGKEIIDTGKVEFSEWEPYKVTAQVSGPTTGGRTVELKSTEKGLEWSCSCTTEKRFCKHCVAAAIGTQNKSKS